MPSAVRVRKCSFTSASSSAAHCEGSTPNNRVACEGVSLRFGISRYSSRTRCSNSANEAGRGDALMSGLMSPTLLSSPERHKSVVLSFLLVVRIVSSGRRTPQAEKQAVRIAADPVPGDGHPEHAREEGDDQNPGDCAADGHRAFGVGFTRRPFSGGVGRIGPERTAWFFTGCPRSVARRTVLAAMIDRLRRVRRADPTRPLTTGTLRHVTFRGRCPVHQKLTVASVQFRSRQTCRAPLYVF
jgi:hypothetical protein